MNLSDLAFQRPWFLLLAAIPLVLVAVRMLRRRSSLRIWLRGL
jgi:hypothetical protein